MDSDIERENHLQLHQYILYNSNNNNHHHHHHHHHQDCARSIIIRGSF